MAADLPQRGIRQKRSTMNPKRSGSAEEFLKDKIGAIAKLRKMGITDFAIITYIVRRGWPAEGQGSAGAPARPIPKRGAKQGAHCREDEGVPVGAPDALAEFEFVEWARDGHLGACRNS
jgi:hypothetical protein